MRTVAWLLLLASPLLAQISARPMQPFVEGGAGVYANLGYHNPVVNGGAGIELEATHVFATAEASAIFDRKLDTGNGHSWQTDAGVYWRASRFLAGAGDRWTKLITSQYEKQGNRPYVGVGYEGTSVRILAQYVTPWFDVQNGLQGPRVSSELVASKHWHVVLIQGVYRYHDTGNLGSRRWGVEDTLGLKFDF